MITKEERARLRDVLCDADVVEHRLLDALDEMEMAVRDEVDKLNNESNAHAEEVAGLVRERDALLDDNHSLYDERRRLLDRISAADADAATLRDSLDSIRTTLADHGATLTRAEKAEAACAAMLEASAFLDTDSDEWTDADWRRLRESRAPDAGTALLAELNDLRAFKALWNEKDGNSPGYNLAKAKTYGDIAHQRGEEMKDLLARHAEEVAGLQRELGRVMCETGSCYECETGACFDTVRTLRARVEVLTAALADLEDVASSLSCINCEAMHTSQPELGDACKMAIQVLAGTNP